jgi:hypothetical protein
LTTFQGVRPGLFHYNTSGQAGGYVDFDNYRAEEPRAGGVERSIPVGQTVVFTSGADGTVLLADGEHHVLVNGAAESAAARFAVVDVGLGRVALKAGNGQFVSVEKEGAVLKDLGDARPGDAETFQWVNLMRGDMMLMSLSNHRYLGTKPEAPGAVTAMAAGPSAARKSGAEFKWKVAE